MYSSSTICTVLLFTFIVFVNSACPPLQSFESTLTHGYVAADFMAVAQQFQTNCNNVTFPPNLDPGVPYNPQENGQVAVYEGDCLVVNLWCGIQLTGVTSSPPITETTLFNSFSVAKAIVGDALIIMNDRGYFQWNHTVASYWPEFGQNGKSQITVEQLFSDSACLPYIAPINISDIELSSDFQRVKHLLEIQSPDSNCRIGIDFGYSPIVVGWYAEVFSTYVDPQHRYITQFIYDEILPITGGELHFGIPLGFTNLTSRVANLRPGVFPTNTRPAAVNLSIEFRDPNSVAYKATYNPLAFMNPLLPNEDLRVPAGLLYTNALSLAQIQRYFTLHNVNGVSIASQKAIAVGTATLFNGTDHNTGDQAAFARALFSKVDPRYLFAPNNQSFGHDGASGTLLFSDPVNRITFSYLTALYSTSSDAHTSRYNAYSLYDAVYASLANQKAPQYCSTQNFPDTQGYFCNSDQTGFYQCLNGVYNSQSAFQQCPRGTTCACDSQTECSAAGSPCI